MTDRRGFLGRLLGAAAAVVAGRFLPETPVAADAADVTWPEITQGNCITLANGDDMMIEWNSEGVMRIGLYTAGEDIPRDVPIAVERNGTGYEVIYFRG